MRAKRVHPDEQIQLILQCRASGLSDYQWCQNNGILPGTFYNWISKLKKRGVTIPEPAYKTEGIPLQQDVVKLDVLSSYHPAVMEQNACIPASPTIAERPTIDIIIGKAEVHFYNDTNPELLKLVLLNLGGGTHAW